MKLVNQSLDYKIFDMDYHLIVNAKQILKSIDENMTRKYGVLSDTANGNLLHRIGIINHLLGDIRNKTILDLGCGAKDSWDYSIHSETSKNGRYYDPWLCRALHELGAKVTGIDGGRSTGEEFKFYEQNLMSSGKLLDSLKDDSVDLTCAFSLFDSPSLYGGKELFHFFLERLDKKIKNDGIFLFEATGTGYYNKEAWRKFLKSRSSSKL